MSRRFPWSVLGLPATADSGEIRRAYAAALKAMEIDTDPAAYANLRRARDAALAQARQRQDRLAQRDSPKELVGEDPSADNAPAAAHSGWPLTAGQFMQGGAASITTRDLETSEVAKILASDTSLRFGEQTSQPGLAVPTSLTNPAEQVILIEPIAGDPALRVVPGETPAGRLAQLLHGSGDGDAPPLEAEEAAAASRLLDQILAEAMAATLPVQQQIEDWLADLLAATWPRSAPLLEAVTAAFGWESEWGKIGERPAMAFLGPRLRGYRFQQQVADPQHRYHTAWTELQRPGTATFLDRVRRSRIEIADLLELIRGNFPELEHLLDPVRVHSWEQTRTVSSWTWILLVIFVVQILGYCARQANSYDELVNDLTDKRAEALELDPAVSELFGPGRTLAWLKGKNPALAQQLEYSKQPQPPNADSVFSGEKVGSLIWQTNYLRQLMAVNAERFDLETLLDYARLRGDLFTIAAGVPTGDCKRLVTTGQLPVAVLVPQDLRTQERELARRMVEAGWLAINGRRSSSKVSVPGRIIERTMRRTKLSESAVAAVMAGEDWGKNSCPVLAALLAETLRDRSLTAEQQRQLLLALS